MEKTRQYSRRKPLILYVESNDEMAETYSPGLEGDFEIVRLRKGQDVLDWLETEEAPNLIVADYQLPDMSAVTIVEAVRGHEEWQHIPVYVLSNHPAHAGGRESDFRGKALAWLVQATLTPSHVAQRLREELDRRGQVG